MWSRGPSVGFRLIHLYRIIWDHMGSILYINDSPNWKIVQEERSNPVAVIAVGLRPLTKDSALFNAYVSDGIVSRLQELTFEEFLNVIMSLRGSNAVTLKARAARICVLFRTPDVKLGPKTHLFGG